MAKTKVKKTKSKSGKSSSKDILFKFSVSDKLKNTFGFELGAKQMTEYVDKLTAVTGFVSSNALSRRHMFIAYGKRLYMVGYSTDTHIAIDTGIETEVDGAFNFDAEVFKGVIKGRGHIEFDYDGNDLNMKSGRFKSSIRTMPITIDQIPAINDLFGRGIDRSESLHKDLLAQIREGVSRTRIIDHLDDMSVSPMTITYKDNQIKITTQTRWAGCVFVANLKAGCDNKPFKMSLTGDVFKLINKVFEGKSEKGASFFMSDRGFSVISDDAVIGLPPLQETDESDLEDFTQLMSTLDTLDPSGSYLLDVQDNLDTINNVVVLLNDKNTGNLKANFGSKGVSLSFENDSGNVSDAFTYQKTTKKGKSKPTKQVIALYPKIYQDALANCKEGNFLAQTYSTMGGEPNILVMDSNHDNDLSKCNLRQFVLLVS